MLCLLGETYTQLYGVLKWEIAGELPMTLMIHGKGEHYSFNLLIQMEKNSVATIMCLLLTTPIQITFLYKTSSISLLIKLIT